MKSSAAKFHMTSYDDLFGNQPENECLLEIPITELYSFHNHPFHVNDDSSMVEMVDSVRENGILSPILVRSRNLGGYEIISGHRRKFAAERAGLVTVPAIQKELSDDEAIVLMVDSNLQREQLLYSEKAYALKMKLEAVKRQGKRNDLTYSQVDRKGENESYSHADCKNENETHSQADCKNRNETSAAEIGNTIDMSESKIRRLVRLTELIPQFMNQVDELKMPFMVGVTLSYLNESNQLELASIMDELAVMPSMAQAECIRNLADNDNFNQDKVRLLFATKKVAPVKINISSNKLYNYFPPEYGKQEMEEVIYNLLQDWHDTHFLLS